MFTGNRAAWRSIHIGDTLLFTVNLIPTHGTLVLILTFKVFPFMRLFFLHTTAALPEMDVAGAGNLPCAEIVFMSNEHIHIDSHSCAAVIDAGTRAQVIAIQLHLGIGIKGIAVFCRQRYACGIEVACYCSRRRNAFPNRIDGADTGVGAGEREVISRCSSFLQFRNFQSHTFDGCTGVNHRCFAYHQLDDMLVAENTDGAAVLIQIQLQIIGIDLCVCARRNGDRMRGFVGSDGICLLYCSRTGDIMLALCAIGIARIYQFARQRIPLELEGMRRAVVHPLNGALPVLEVVDLFAIQRDGLHAPCVGDDRGRLVIHSLDNKGISSRIVFRFPVIGEILVVAVGILRRKSAVARLDGVLPQQLVGQLIDFVTLQALFHRRGAVLIILVIFISRESFVEGTAVQLCRHLIRHSPLLFIIHQREFRSQPEFLAEVAAADDHFGRGKAVFKAGSRPCLYLSEEGAAFNLGERHFTVARGAACAVEHDILFKGAAGDDDARGRFIPLAIADIHTHRPLEGTAGDGHFGVIICNQRVATGAVVQIIKLVKELGRVCVAVFVCLRRNIERTSVDDNLSAIMAIDRPSPQNTSE